MAEFSADQILVFVFYSMFHYGKLFLNIDFVLHTLSHLEKNVANSGLLSSPVPEILDFTLKLYAVCIP